MGKIAEMTMEVKMKECQEKLTKLWFFGACALFFVLLFQTILDHYGHKSNDAWRWFLPTIMPTLSLIVGVIVAETLTKTDKSRMVDRFIYRLAFVVSSVYLVVVSLTIFLQPFASIGPIELMNLSHLWLGPLQGLASAFIGIFFVKGIQT